MKNSIDTIREQILESDEFVLAETKKIQYLYGLKTEIRYNRTREEELPTESVADHVYAMHIVANYFLPLEDPDGKLNRADIFNTINWHDADEIETGDMLGQHKTDADRAREADAMKVLIGKLPEHMRAEVIRVMDAYEAQSTPEAQFVKAVDKLEVIFQIYQEPYKQIFIDNQTTVDQHQRIKLPYIKNYPTMQRFNEVVTNAMIEEKYFIDTN